MIVQASVSFEDMLNAVFEHIEALDFAALSSVSKNYADRLRCAADLIERRLQEKQKSWDDIVARAQPRVVQCSGDQSGQTERQVQ